MPRVLIRPLVLGLLSLALAAPAADAAIGDAYIPDSQTLPGVSLVTKPDGRRGVHFGPKAAKLFKTVAGRRATMACGTLVDDEGWLANDQGAQTTDTLP